jgi:hypothetical protein
MTFGTTAFALGSTTHTTRVLRNMVGAVFGLPMVSHSNAVSPSTRGGAYGVGPYGDMLVTTTGGLGYSIAAGEAVVTGTFALGQGVFTGKRIYETDTGVNKVYNGATWVTTDVGAPTAWSTFTVTNNTFAVSNTVTRGWYQQMNGVFNAHMSATFTGGSATSNQIHFVTLPLTLANTEDIGGTWEVVIGAALYSGIVCPFSTTQVVLLVSTDVGAGSPPTGYFGANPAVGLSAGNAIKVNITGRYA